MTRSARRAIAAAAVLGAVLLTLPGCGAWSFTESMAHPTHAVRPPDDAAPASTSTPAPAPARTVAMASIHDGRGFPGPFDGTVTVRADAPVTGLPPIGQLVVQCAFPDPAAERYVELDVSFSNWTGSIASLSAALTVRPTPGHPDSTGRVGIFAAGSGDVHYCQDGDRTPSSEHVDVDTGAGEERTFTVYLVTEGEAPAADEALADATLAFTDLRNTAYSPPELTTVGHWSVQGATCPGSSASICAQLG